MITMNHKLLSLAAVMLLAVAGTAAALDAQLDMNFQNPVAVKGVTGGYVKFSTPTSGAQFEGTSASGTPLTGQNVMMFAAAQSSTGQGDIGKMYMDVGSGYYILLQGDSLHRGVAYFDTPDGKKHRLDSSNTATDWRIVSFQVYSVSTTSAKTGVYSLAANYRDNPSATINGWNWQGSGFAYTSAYQTQPFTDTNGDTKTLSYLPNNYFGLAYLGAGGAATPVPTATTAPAQTLCTDSDSGIDYYRRGTAAISNKQTGQAITAYTDSCAGDTLTEYRCTGSPTLGNMQATAENKPCASLNSGSYTYTCSNGACVSTATPTPAAMTCTDYDGGKSYGTASYTIDSNGVRRDDSCPSSTTLTEQYCYNTATGAVMASGTAIPTLESYACPNGCSGGKCNPAPTATPVASCPAGQFTCSGDNTRCVTACPGDACTDGAWRCSGSSSQNCGRTCTLNTPAVCSASGWSTIANCATGCNSATGQCNPATPTPYVPSNCDATQAGVSRCSASGVETCNQVCTLFVFCGWQWQTTQTCSALGCESSPTVRCATPTPIPCPTDECVVNALQCSGSNQQKCVSTAVTVGTRTCQVAKWQTQQTCASGCTGGACIVPLPESCSIAPAASQQQTARFTVTLNNIVGSPAATTFTYNANADGATPASSPAGNQQATATKTGAAWVTTLSGAYPVTTQTTYRVTARTPAGSTCSNVVTVLPPATALPSCAIALNPTTRTGAGSATATGTLSSAASVASVKVNCNTHSLTPGTTTPAGYNAAPLSGVTFTSNCGYAAVTATTAYTVSGQVTLSDGRSATCGTATFYSLPATPPTPSPTTPPALCGTVSDPACPGGRLVDGGTHPNGCPKPKICLPNSTHPQPGDQPGPAVFVVTVYTTDGVTWKIKSTPVILTENLG